MQQFEQVWTVDGSVLEASVSQTRQFEGVSCRLTGWHNPYGDRTGESITGADLVERECQGP